MLKAICVSTGEAVPKVTRGVKLDLVKTWISAPWEILKC